MLQYARSVPKPRVAASSPGNKAQSAPPATGAGLHGNSDGGGGSLDNDAQMLELERLAQRHAREKQQTEAIRQNLEGAISAK